MRSMDAFIGRMRGLLPRRSPVIDGLNTFMGQMNGSVRRGIGFNRSRDAFARQPARPPHKLASGSGRPHAS
jgi:hypothetical protein